MAIVNRIGDIARQKGIKTSQDFARATGFAYDTAHSLFTGRAIRIGLDTLDKVCEVLDAEPGELLVRIKPPKESVVAMATDNDNN
jgi:putative transcriptional regulator